MDTMIIPCQKDFVCNKTFNIQQLRKIKFMHFICDKITYLHDDYPFIHENIFYICDDKRSLRNNRPFPSDNIPYINNIKALILQNIVK